MTENQTDVLKIERVKVESSQIESAGFMITNYEEDFLEGNRRELGVLEVEFKGKLKNSLYRYYKIDSKTAKDFMEAESKGKFLGQNIKGRFAFERVGEIEHTRPEVGNEKIS